VTKTTEPEAHSHEHSHDHGHDCGPDCTHESHQHEHGHGWAPCLSAAPTAHGRPWRCQLGPTWGRA
jgi:hypothetical protein